MPVGVGGHFEFNGELCFLCCFCCGSWSVTSGFLCRHVLDLDKVVSTNLWLARDWAPETVMDDVWLNKRRDSYCECDCGQ